MAKSVDIENLRNAIYAKNASEVERLLKAFLTMTEIFVAPKDKSINQKDAEGNTLLHLAIQQAIQSGTEESVAIVQRLLQHPGIDVNCQNREGDTPLHLVVSAKGWSLKRYETYKALFDLLRDRKELNVNVKNRVDNTPLHSACLNEDYATALQMLYPLGLRNARDDGPRRISKVAFDCTHTMIRRLREHGANLNIVNSAGKTPLALLAKVHEDKARMTSGFENACKLADLEASTRPSSHDLKRSVSAPDVRQPGNTNAAPAVNSHIANTVSTTASVSETSHQNGVVNSQQRHVQLVTNLDKYICNLEAKVKRQEETLLGRAHLWLSKLNPANQKEKIKVAIALRDAHSEKNKTSIEKIYSNSKNCFLLSEGNLGKIVLRGNAPVKQQHVRKRSNSI